MKIFRIITIILLIALMMFIYSMSAETASESTETSDTVIILISKIFIKDFEKLSVAEQNELIDSVEFLVRKAAHFTIYALLGVLSYLSVVTYKKLSVILRSVISASICLVYAISDEIHQYFVPGRSCEIRDVCIDFCGALLTITILTLIVKFSKIKFIKNLRGE